MIIDFPFHSNQEKGEFGAGFVNLLFFSLLLFPFFLFLVHLLLLFLN